MTGPHTDRSKIAQRFETDVVEPMDDFDDPSQEWRRLFSEALGTFIVQLLGATLACLFLQHVVDVSATFGSNYPAAGYSNMSAFWMEFILTLGLVSVILGTASGAQNIGIVGAFGVGGYIALAGLWGSPISGTSMNPARTFGPDLVGADFSSYWVYVAGPLAGAAVAANRQGGRLRRLRQTPEGPA
jgi:aquaporin Z